MNYLSPNNKKYLLINSCSKNKKTLYGVKAVDLYDGPAFKIIRRYKPKNVDLLILSAKYGLIKGDDVIDYYDEKMTPSKAKTMSGDIRDTLQIVIEKFRYDEIFINLGKDYMLALKNTDDLLANLNVLYAQGPIGMRLHQLKQWLLSKGGAGIDLR